MWGGATFDTSMRFLQEDPWDRLDQLRERVPNILFQMLLRASNAVGYTNYPDNVVARVHQAQRAEHGIDVFRIFDSLNWIENMKVAIEAVREQTRTRICEAAICYTGDILDPKRTKYCLKYYVKMAKELVKMGTHILAHQGHGRAVQAVRGVRAGEGAARRGRTCRSTSTRTTPAASTPASVLRAADAGVDIADAALASMSGMTSQPNLNSLVAALRHTPRDTGLDLDALNRLSDYWEAVRELYYPFEEGMKAGTAEVYQHEMPGGQYTNLRQQAKSLGLEDRWHEIADAYAAGEPALRRHREGDAVEQGRRRPGAVHGHQRPDARWTCSTPSKKLNFPRERRRDDAGPCSASPKAAGRRCLQKIILDSAGAKPIKGRPGAKLPKVDFAAARKELADEDRAASRATRTCCRYLMYPQVFLDFDKHLKAVRQHAASSRRRAFFYGLQSGDEIAVEIEPGKTLIIRYLTTGEPREDGTRTVFFELNGQPREVDVADRSLEGDAAQAPQGRPGRPEPRRRADARQGVATSR